MLVPLIKSYVILNEEYDILQLEERTVTQWVCVEKLTDAILF